jgi:hypothetical protein
MIKFKSFVNAIHEAILNANQSLMDKNAGLIEEYFEPCNEDHGHEEGEGPTLRPKSVKIEYPYQTENGMDKVEIHVPLITLVPLQLSQIKKAKFTAQFEIEVQDDELNLHFYDGRRRPKKGRTTGNLELTFSPQEMPEGLDEIVAGYEAALKRQIPG